MSNIELYAAIAVMAGVNFFTRLFPFLFFRKNVLPLSLVYVQKYFPAVIMTILIFYSIKDISFTQMPYGMKEIVSIVFTAILHLGIKNYLISIFGGTICYMALVQLIA